MNGGREMPCLLLHRAVSNAGDFLIRDRTLALFATHRPDLATRVGRAWRPLAEQFDPQALATFRAIVICGGPGYQRSMYPEVYPLGALDSIRVPVFLMALGSYSLREPQPKTFLDRRSVAFLRWVGAGGGRLGTRDLVTDRAVRSLGAGPTVMVGDPAWYDHDWLDCSDYTRSGAAVVFTPPANPLFHPQGAALLSALVRNVGAANVTVVFHRGIQRTFELLGRALGVATWDISGSAEGFAVFDEADLHVGYRVHAHLYCTSHATPSYLIAEDSRGLGVLETLGALGVSGLDRAPGLLTERAWRWLPRLGSDRRELTRRLGLGVARGARLADVSEKLLRQIERDRREGFPRHAAAKEQIRETYPKMIDMLGSIP